MVCLFVAISVYGFREVSSSFQRVVDDGDARQVVQEELKLFLDRETGLRGYAATGDQRFLQPFEHAQREIPAITGEAERRLRALGLFAAMRRQAQIDAIQNEWQMAVARNLLSRPQPALAIRAQLRGKQLMDQTRLFVNEIRRFVTEDRAATVVNTRRDLTVLIVAAAALALVLTLIAMWIDALRSRAASEFTARLESAALYDVLTGLPNRRLFFETLSQALAQARRSRQLASVLFLDLDGFKDVNDRFGHEAGDEVLCVVAKRLKETVRKSDFVARLGGDEFTLILSTMQERNEARLVAEKIIENTRPCVRLRSGYEVTVSVSIGISLYPEDAEDADGLLASADSAMFDAKRAGKNRVAFFGSVESSY